MLVLVLPCSFDCCLVTLVL